MYDSLEAIPKNPQVYYHFLARDYNSYLALAAWEQLPGTSHLVPAAWYLLSTCYLTYQLPSTTYLEPRIWC